MIRHALFYILALFGCRHDWHVSERGMDCTVERCCKCGSERYTTEGDAWGM